MGLLLRCANRERRVHWLTGLCLYMPVFSEIVVHRMQLLAEIATAQNSYVIGRGGLVNTRLPCGSPS